VIEVSISTDRSTKAGTFVKVLTVVGSAPTVFLMPHDGTHSRTSSAIRSANRSLIVDVLRVNGQATRSQLRELTGLSRATVSALVGELAERGLLVEESDAETGSTGRPVGVLSLDRSNGLGLGIDIGVRHVAVAVGDLGRNVYAERWRQAPVGHASSSGLEAVVAEVKAALHEAGADLDHLVGAVVGLAAPVSVHGGRIAEPKLLPGWAEGRLAGHLADALGVPVKLENTATLGALGEYVWGRAAGISDLVYVKLASRVGAGLVINGSLYRGADGLAGEFGHLTLDPNGPPCRCGGRGCLELYAGGSAILRDLGRRDTGDGIELLIADALAGDRAVVDAVTRAARHLGQGLASLAKLLNPQRIVIGGEFSQLANLITDPAGEELTRSCFTSASSIEVSSLGRRASLLGALALVLTQPSRVHARTAVPRLPGGGGAAPHVLTFPTRDPRAVHDQART
jgi:predicted NBD/HSP70 family sugar kinase